MAYTIRTAIFTLAIIPPTGCICLGSYLIAVVRTPNTMLIRSVEGGYSCLAPDFSGKAFSFLLLSIILSLNLS